MNNFNKIKEMNIDEFARLLAYSQCRICENKDIKWCMDELGGGCCHTGIKNFLLQKYDKNNIVGNILEKAQNEK